MQAEDRGRYVLTLFETYYERVFCFARRSVDSATAEDVAQEVFTRLLDHQGIEERSLSASYLIKMAENLIRRRYHKLRRQEAHHEKLLYESDQASALARGRSHGAEEEDPALGDREPEPTEPAKIPSLESLKTREQEALRLIVCQGLSYEQAASSLGVSVTSVNNWKFRGLQRLRQHTERGRSEPRSTRRSAPGRHAG